MNCCVYPKLKFNFLWNSPLKQGEEIHFSLVNWTSARVPDNHPEHIHISNFKITLIQKTRFTKLKQYIIPGRTKLSVRTEKIRVKEQSYKFPIEEWDWESWKGYFIIPPALSPSMKLENIPTALDSELMTEIQYTIKVKGKTSVGNYIQKIHVEIESETVEPQTFVCTEKCPYKTCRFDEGQLYCSDYLDHPVPRICFLEPTFVASGIRLEEGTSIVLSASSQEQLEKYF